MTINSTQEEILREITEVQAERRANWQSLGEMMSQCINPDLEFLHLEKLARLKSQLTDYPSPEPLRRS